MAEGLGKACCEGIEEDVFDGLEAEWGFVEFAAALGVADMKPVGGAVAGAAKALGVDEGFQEDGGEAVAAFPIVRELVSDASEDVRGEVGDVNPRQDQEAGVVDHEVEVVLSLGRSPADEAVAWGDGPGGGTKSEGGEQVGFFWARGLW